MRGQSQDRHTNCGDGGGGHVIIGYRYIIIEQVRKAGPYFPEKRSKMNCSTGSASSLVLYPVSSFQPFFLLTVETLCSVPALGQVGVKVPSEV